MASKGKPKKNGDPEELQLFRKLKTYVSTASRGKMKKGRMFSNCVRASFSICYEFNLHAWSEKNAESAFFWLPTLRGCCEDLIVLNYMKDLPASDREELIALVMSHELHARLTAQSAFFKAVHPFQPHLRPQLSRERLESLETNIHKIWQTNGWPKMNRGTIPPTRQMAEKKGGLILEALYDYLYRLTSATVHFNISGLLRTGWGNVPDCTFSTSHFSGYYKMFGRVYGAYMFCCYFELFARYLRTTQKEKKIVNEIRNSILELPRWPEMVTFEEMNMKPPKMEILQVVGALMHAGSQSGLLSGK